MNKLKTILTGLALVGMLTSTTANAIVLSMTPASQTAGAGASVSVDLVASGLGAAGPDSIGAFDVDILYDATFLSFDSYTLSGALGGAADILDLSFGDLGGAVDLAVSSFLFDFELDALQGSTVTLATLAFTTTAAFVPGSSTVVSVDGNDTFLEVSDAVFTPGGLPITALNDATIRNPSTGGVPAPEPGMFALALVGMFGVLFARRRSSVA